MQKDLLLKIVQHLLQTEVLIINTGAGMSADSGIPTYRGSHGSWGKVEKEFNKEVTEIMTPKFIDDHPVLMWKRFSKGYDSLKSIVPHAGYRILREWTKKMLPHHFQRRSTICLQWFFRREFV